MAAVNSGHDTVTGGPTVTVRFTQAILQTAERLGLTLPPDLVASLHGRERVSLDLHDRLWQAVCEASDDPMIGLELGLGVQVGHLDAAGMLLITCETFGEAVDSLLDYYPIVGEGGAFDLTRDGDCHAVAYEPRYAACRAQRVEAVLATLVNLSRWSTGDAFAVESVRFAHAPPASPDRYRERLGAPVEFAADANALVFPSECMRLPLIQANPALCRQLHVLADEMLAELGNRSLSAQVQRLLRDRPRSGKERVAEALGMSGRHLVRRLADEGASFKVLRARQLQELAKQGLRDERRVADIGESLGFSDESAFIKAFKRWTGVTPAQFRERL